MCGRYARRSDKQKIAELFAVHGSVIPEFGPSWNVAPQSFQRWCDRTATPANEKSSLCDGVSSSSGYRPRNRSHDPSSDPRQW
jgi:putative SOS response-associated peptidase YedK